MEVGAGVAGWLEAACFRSFVQLIVATARSVPGRGGGREVAALQARCITALRM